MNIDVLIFGGGVAGLWTLDELHRRGLRALLIESHALGAGQTIAAQGILHSGLKYALSGLLNPAAGIAGQMTDLWRRCLAGVSTPELSRVRVSSPCCYLWRTESISSSLGMIGAKLGLRTPAVKVDARDRPAILKSCPGEVLRIDEPVIDVASLLGELAAKHAERIILVHDERQLRFEMSGAAQVASVFIRARENTQELQIKPKWVVLTGGAGNEALRKSFGMDAPIMQRRPLHMVLVRGAIPALFGHCIDGSKTRVTITSHIAGSGDTVWQVGGNVAEQGVSLSESELIAFARKEVTAVLPGFKLNETEWATYRIDRAEGKNALGSRPDGPDVRREGNAITAWPTKLVLAPRLAVMVADEIGDGANGDAGDFSLPADWLRPTVASPLWETVKVWHS